MVAIMSTMAIVYTNKETRGLIRITLYSSYYVYNGNSIYGVRLAY